MSGGGGSGKTDLHSVTKNSTRLIRPPRAVEGKVVFVNYEAPCHSFGEVVIRHFTRC